eukprot:tig00000402_g189.t1
MPSAPASGQVQSGRGSPPRSSFDSDDSTSVSFAREPVVMMPLPPDAGSFYTSSSPQPDAIAALTSFLGPRVVQIPLAEPESPALEGAEEIELPAEAERPPMSPRSGSRSNRRASVLAAGEANLGSPRGVAERSFPMALPQTNPKGRDGAPATPAGRGGRNRANSLLAHFFQQQPSGAAMAGGVIFSIRNLHIGTAPAEESALERARRLLREERGAEAPREVIRDFSAVIRGGEMWLLMGPPGSGKSSLLQTLAGRSRLLGLRYRGEMTLNGDSPRQCHWHRRVGLVEQQDAHFATLTVRETVAFAVRCRLPGRPSEQEIAARVALALEITGLAHVADSIVGSQELRGVSGGERRRLSVAVEAVIGSPVLLLDEPSNGLDAAATLELCGAGRALADTGHAVVMSLLQPSPEAYALFDKLVLLSGGEVLYCGPAGDAPAAFFEALGYRRPPSTPVPDFLSFVTEPDGRRFFFEAAPAPPSSPSKPPPVAVLPPSPPSRAPSPSPSPSKPSRAASPAPPPSDRRGFAGASNSRAPSPSPSAPPPSSAPPSASVPLDRRGFAEAYRASALYSELGRELWAAGDEVPASA